MNSTKTLPSIYLSNLQKKTFKNKQTERKRWNTIFVILEENRYLKWIYTPIFPDMAYDYFTRQKLLFKYFSVQKNIAAKVYPVTYGWKQAEWIKLKYPSIELLTTGKFVNYALKSKLIIIDYIGTSFLEILAMRIPFLATWNRRWFRGDKIFERFIDRLKETGIFHETPETLTESYSQIIADTQQWWQENKRQKLIKEMADRFAMTSDTAYEKWALEFKKNTLPRRLI